MSIFERLLKTGFTVNFVCFLVEPVTEFGSLIEGTGLSATFGTDEVRKIHEENVNKLAGMSQEEIMAEQSKLLEMLGKLAVKRYIGRAYNHEILVLQ